MEPKIIKLTKHADYIDLPVGVYYYPVCLLINEELKDEIISLFSKLSYRKQPEIWRIPYKVTARREWSPYDYNIFSNDHLNSFWWLSVSKKVFNNIKFKEIIVEYLI